MFDASILLKYPAFAPLKDEAVFKSASVEYGVVVWNNGDIDIAPESIYEQSYAYEEMSRLPVVQEFEKSLDEAQKWAAAAGYKESDVNDIVKSVRKRGRE